MDRKEKITRIFQMTPDTAMMFFTIVKWSTDHGVKDTAKFRQYILNWLGIMGHMDRVYDTKRSEQEIVSNYHQQGYNIIYKHKSKRTLWDKIKGWFK